MRVLIGEQIRKLREDHILTQEDMAKKLSMSRQRYARIEKGQADISYDLILSVASIFDISADTITDVCKQEDEMFMRASKDDTASVAFITDMIDFFYANKSIYEQMHEEYAHG